MFSFKKKKMPKNAKKIKETKELWDKFQNVHNKVYSVKLSLKSLLNTKKEIRSKEMPPMLSKSGKQRRTNERVKILKSQLIIIKEDALIIQQSIEIEEALLGLEKKTFEFPNLNVLGLNKKCKQFELLLESFEKEIKILKIEEERRGQVENLITDCKVKVAPENDKIVFESILESSEEELKILEIEKNPYYQLHEQVEKPIKDCKIEVQ